MKSGGERQLQHDNFDNSIPKMGDVVMTMNKKDVVFGTIAAERMVKFGGKFFDVRTENGEILTRTYSTVNVLVTADFFRRNQK